MTSVLAEYPYSTLETLGFFVGIPLAVALLVSLLVLAPGWTRNARRGGSTSWSGEALWIGNAAVGERPSILAAESEDDRGGASARW